MKKLLITGILSLILLCALIAPSIVLAGSLCPVCGSTVDTHLEWNTWETNGFQHSGCILCCDKCGYTTCRDAMGNVPDPYLANKAWQAKMFPWIHSGWTHAQSLEGK